MAKPSNQHVNTGPWYTLLTIDLIIYAAQKTVLHPFVAWMLPLCLRAVTVPYSHISFQLTTAYASLLTLFAVVSVFNHRLAFGIPREVDLSEEVVVITGGASGLGQSIANFYQMKGCSVAILDVKHVAEEELGGIQYYKCDVGDPEQIKRAAEKIKKDVCR
jgi:NADPH:quinone reductase-like Zn-dependent oxidoreductase